MNHYATPTLTPNTRSKRKRIYEGSSQDDIMRLSWNHEDAGLRSEVKKAAARNPIELPAPTQAIRPISSRCAASPSSSRPSLPSGNQRHAASRTRRKVKSLDGALRLGLASSMMLNIRGSASVPGLESGSGSAPKEILDDLMDRLEEANLGENVRQSGLGLGVGSSGCGETSSRRALQDVSGNARSDGSPRVRGAGEGVKTGTGQNNSHHIRSILSPTKTAPPLGLRLSRSQHQSNPTSRPVANSLSSTKSTSLTSVGKITTGIQRDASVSKADYSRIATRPASSTTKTSANPAKPFKPPFSRDQPTRSSPRHKLLPPQHPPPPQRNQPPPLRAQLSTSTSASEPRTPRLSDLSTETAPSSDSPSTGDESFGSFDGLLEQGGDDVEQFLKSLDAPPRA